MNSGLNKELEIAKDGGYHMIKFFISSHKFFVSTSKTYVVMNWKHRFYYPIAYFKFMRLMLMDYEQT